MRNAGKGGELSGSGGGSVPETDQPYMQLVTNANGETVWEEKTHYYEPAKSASAEVEMYKYSGSGVNANHATYANPLDIELKVGETYRIQAEFYEEGAHISEFDLDTTAVAYEVNGHPALGTADLLFGVDTALMDGISQWCYGYSGAYITTSGEVIIEEGYHLMIRSSGYHPTTVNLTISEAADTIKPIDERYIPEMSGVIVKSSTSGSSKRFKITVDDSGTLTATEVTK